MVSTTVHELQDIGELMGKAVVNKVGYMLKPMASSDRIATTLQLLVASFE